MSNHRWPFRLVCSVFAAGLMIASLPIREDATQILTVKADAAPTASRTLPIEPLRIRDVATEIPYIADATKGELDALIDYAAGRNPTQGKSIEEKGQNIKRNTATTVIDIFRQTRPASSFYFKLIPYGEDKNVYEVCAFYTPLFSKDEKMVHTGMIHDYNTNTIYRTDGTGILGIGYDFNFAFDTYYAADDPWQRNFGFCTLYDALAFTIGDFCTTIRVPFTYDGRDWMIQIWKGIYSNNMLGGEIGLYNKPTDRKSTFYDCAADPDRIEMSFTVCRGDELIVESEHKTTWWQTAFTYHSPALPSKLTLSGRLTLKDRAMADAFVASLRAQNKDVEIRQNGKYVEFTW